MQVGVVVVIGSFPNFVPSSQLGESIVSTFYP